METVKEYFNQAKEAAAEVKTIAGLIEGETGTQPDLAELQIKDSQGRLSVWGRILYVFSFLSWLQKVSIERLRADIQKTVNQSYVGTAPWYVKQVKDFQYGDPLTLDDATGKYSYGALDPEKQVVKFAAMNAGLIKVAGKSSEGKPVALAADQVTGLNAYLDRVGIWGAVPRAISYPADSMKLQMTIYYNALNNLERVKQEVNDAVSGYLSNLDFNGTMYLSRLIDAVQQVEGVTDVVIDLAEAKHSVSEYRAIQRIYQPLSGYMEIDASYPLADNLTFLPS